MFKDIQRDYLISHEEETLLCSESNYILNALSALNLTCKNKKAHNRAATLADSYLAMLPSSGSLRRWFKGFILSSSSCFFYIYIYIL